MNGRPDSSMTQLHRDLPGQIARVLGVRILRGDYLPGQAFPNEHELVGEFSISRSVIREGIKLLSAKGLAEPRPLIAGS